MGYINQNIDDELDTQFRKLIFSKYGMKKGVILRGLEDSIKLWIKTQEEKSLQHSQSDIIDDLVDKNNFRDEVKKVRKNSRQR